MNIIVGLIVIAGIGVAGVVAPLAVHAESNELSWSSQPSLQSKAVVGYTECDSVEQLVEIDGDQSRQSVCLRSSDGFRVGRFLDNKARPMFAVGFRYDQKLYRLDGCDSIARCQYIPSRDLMIVELYSPSSGSSALSLYGRFSQRIVKQEADGVTKYVFDRTRADYNYQQVNGTPWPVGDTSVSQNGSWISMTLMQEGIGVMNLTTFEVAQVVATSFSSAGFTVSNDGRWLASVGMPYSFVTPIADSCRRVINAQTPPAGPRTSLCPQFFMNPEQFIESSVRLSSPMFSSDGGLLSIVSTDAQGIITRVILKASGYNILPIDYLAIGDSFSSGEGEISDAYYNDETNTVDNTCHVSRRSYPFLLAVEQRLALKSVACSGARIHDVVGSERPGVPLQSTFVERYQPAVVTVGIGGNDAGLMSKLKACIMPDTCEWASDSTSRKKTAAEILSQYDSMVTMYSQLRNMSPGSQIYAVGYPKITEPEGECTLLTESLFNYKERLFANESIQYLNQVIKAAAVKTGAKYIDIEKSLGAHTICGSEISAVNEFRVSGDIAPSSTIEWTKVFANETFHPTPLGHQLMAQSINRQIPNLSDGSVCAEGVCVPEDSSLDAPAYWMTNGNDVTELPHQTIGDFIVSVVNSFARPLVEIQLFKDSLQPGSQVQIEIHSKPVHLGTYTVGLDGDFNQIITLPSDLTPGVHTIHIYGTSPSGEPIDMYQTINYNPDSSPNATIEQLSHSPTASSNLVSHTFRIAEQRAGPAVQKSFSPLAIAATVYEANVKGVQIAHQVFRSISTIKKVPLMLVFAVILIGVGATVFIVFLIRRRARYMNDPSQSTS